MVVAYHLGGLVSVEWSHALGWKNNCMSCDIAIRLHATQASLAADRVAAIRHSQEFHTHRSHAS